MKENNFCQTFCYKICIIVSIFLAVYVHIYSSEVVVEQQQQQQVRLLLLAATLSLKRLYLKLFYFTIKTYNNVQFFVILCYTVK